MPDIDYLDFDPPDLEPLTGWRAWAVEPGPLLASLAYGDGIWPPREELVARCHSDHEPPVAKCTCGVYAAATRAALLDLGYANYNLDSGCCVVIGEVSLWGGVIEGERAHRAQYAYPRSLLVPFEAWVWAKPLRETYGVPTRLANILRLND